MMQSNWMKIRERDELTVDRRQEKLFVFLLTIVGSENENNFTSSMRTNQISRFFLMTLFSVSSQNHFLPHIVQNSEIMLFSQIQPPDEYEVDFRAKLITPNERREMFNVMHKLLAASHFTLVRCSRVFKHYSTARFYARLSSRVAIMTIRCCFVFDKSSDIARCAACVPSQIFVCSIIMLTLNMVLNSRCCVIDLMNHVRSEGISRSI